MLQAGKIITDAGALEATGDVAAGETTTAGATAVNPRTGTSARRDGHHLKRRCRDDCAIEFGVDEVARGCLFGRVYAGAVCWGDAPLPEPMPKGIVLRDSKKMSAKQRERADAFIRQHARGVAIAYRTEKFVDERNILVAAQESMRSAVLDLARDLQCDPGHVVVDGDRFSMLVLARGPVPHTCVPKADDTYLSVACAAICAKVAHDRYVRALCAAHPALDARYGLLSNMGYGSARHRDGIATHGISQFHRRTFGRCALAKMNLVENITGEKSGDEGSGGGGVAVASVE